MFRPLPPVPDHPALEEEILAWWEERQTFDRLREQNADGPVWSFVDGPVTANKTLGVHTAWGRTLKDVFQRYKGLRGFHQRYQNGFDCQGLWIEVGVERELGLNSKHEIEEYGLAEFSRRCREKVVWSAGEITRGCVRLGQWMDWGNDYFTFSDTNIEYIWGFLKRMHEQGYLYLGHRSTEWCPRCGTSISAHELVGSYEDRIDPSLFVRLPLDRPSGRGARRVDDHARGRCPANVAAAVNPDGGVRPARERRVGRRAPPSRRAARGSPPRRRARRLALRGPVRRPARRGRGRAPRHPVGRRLDGRRHGDRPHRAGLRLRGLRALARARPRRAHAGRRGRALLRRLRLAARARHRRGGRPARRRPRRARPPDRRGHDRAPLPVLLALPHAAHLPDLRRLVHRRRGAAPEADRRERDDRLDARVLRQADGRLAAQPRRLEHLAPALLRPAAAVLSVRRVRASDRRRLEGRALRQGDRRAGAARGAPPPVGRRGDDPLRRLRRRRRAPRRRGRRRLARRRHRPVLDARLGEPEFDRGRLRDRRLEGALDRRPARPRALGDVVPGRLGDRDARADPPVVLLAALHVGGARREGAVQARRSATRRCSTSTAARCTAPGGT